MVRLLFLFVAVILSAWWLTELVRQYALAQRILDVPNERSSHLAVIPRGGGLSIVVTTLAALPILGVLGFVAWPFVWGLLGGGGLVAAIGFVDDRGHVAPRWRLLGHFTAAVWILAWLGGWPAVQVFGRAIGLGWIGHGLAALYMVWLLNLTNFMDGIDGIAGVETISVCVGCGLLSLLSEPGGTLWIVPLVVASSTLGFLRWNWPPAKIFMGDAGSGFLGLTMATLSLQAAWAASPLFWSWVILLGVFVVDATVTLLRRVARGEPWYTAHCSHAYQHAARRWGEHRRVTRAVCAINLCWLLPIAFLVACGSVEGVTGVLVAYAPLLAAALWLGAGKPAPA